VDERRVERDCDIVCGPPCSLNHTSLKQACAYSPTLSLRRGVAETATEGAREREGREEEEERESQGRGEV